MRLTPSAVSRLPEAVDRFRYNRTAQGVGIVHLGIGAFHRAHQAWYTDRAMDGGDRDWAITGISLRSSSAANQLNPQGGLFTVIERSRAGVTYRIVGSVRNVLPPATMRRRAPQHIAASETRIVSLTVTEKGYCRRPDGSIDVEAAKGEGSIYPVLVEALRLRRDRNAGGIALLSCDNLAQNGEQLSRLFIDFCEQIDPRLSSWVAKECTFPSTMVDRIVPATAQSDYDRLHRELGLDDQAAVVTEPFSQWVVEDRFPSGRPSWQIVGAQLVNDVAPYETAKLRMLNGAHSALAYLGLSKGHDFVDEAIADPDIRPVIESLIRCESANSLSLAEGQNLQAYADSLLERFENPALKHKLSQIAMDGSEKIRQRWLDTLAFHEKAARLCPSLLTALAAWLRHVRGDNGIVADPRADQLRTAWQASGERGIVQTLFGTGGLIASDWTPSADDLEFIQRKLARSI